MRRTFFRISLAVVFATAAASLFAGTLSLPEQLVPQMLGISVQSSGVNDAEVARIADAGFKVVRTVLLWTDVEKAKGTYDFAACDALMQSLATKNIRPIIVLNGANPLYESGSPPHTAEGRNAFSEFAGAAAARYKDKGVIWEIWSEPNSALTWAPKPNPEDYTALVKAASTAIKTADPSAAVIGPATAGIDLEFIRKCLSLGLLKSIDTLSVRPGRLAAPETIIDGYRKLRELVADYAQKGKQTPVVSEEDAGSTSERQAQHLSRSLLVNALAGVGLSIAPDDGAQAVSAVQTLARELDGCKFVRRIGGSDEDYLLLFKGSNGYRLAGWTTGGEHEVSIPMDLSKVTVVSLDGARSELDVADGKLALKLSQSPMYIEAAGSELLALEEAVDIGTDLDTHWRVQDEVNFTIFNTLAKPLKGEAVLNVPGQKKPFSRRFSVAAGNSEKFQFTPTIVWDGRSSVVADARVTFDGFTSPVTRKVDLGTAHRLTANATSPMDRIMEFRVVNPAGNRIKGKLNLVGVKGLKPMDNSTKFDVQGQAAIAFTLIEPASKEFSFGYELEDSVGKVVFRAPVLKYTLVDDLAGSDLNTVPAGYDFVVDGDSSVEATADAYCVQQSSQYTAIQHLPVCRLRYNTGSGRRSFRLTPKSDLPLPENPLEIGMWVQGDGKGAKLRCRFVDSTGQTFQPNGFELNSNQWRYRTMPLDGRDAEYWGGAGDGKVHGPIKWDSLVVIDPEGAAAHGSIYIGPIMVVSELTASDLASEEKPVEKKPEEKKKKKKFILF